MRQGKGIISHSVPCRRNLRFNNARSVRTAEGKSENKFICSCFSCFSNYGSQDFLVSRGAVSAREKLLPTGLGC